MNYNIICIIIYEKMTKYSREQSLNNTWIEQWNISMKGREKKKKRKRNEKVKKKSIKEKKNIWIICVNRKSRNSPFIFKKFKTKSIMKTNYEFDWLQKNAILYDIL